MGQYKIIPGYIYILTNPAWPDWVKIGRNAKCSRGGLEGRIRSYNTSSPLRDYACEYFIEVKDTGLVERYFKDRYEDSCSEWYNISVEDAKNVINQCLGRF